MSPPVPLNKNLILNGKFIDHGTHWTATATLPGSVDFSQRSCIVRTQGMAEQTVRVVDATAYTLSLFTLITYRGTGSITVVFQPSGVNESISMSGNQGWLRQSLTFTPPTGTVSATVQLTGTSGDVWFDNVRLVEEDGTTIPIELIRNGDFSRNGDEWTSSPPPNLATFHDQQCQLNLGAYIEQDIRVVPGQALAFSIDAQTPTGGHGVVMFHITPDHVPELELRGEGGWDTYTYLFTIPDGIHDITLQIQGMTFLIVDNISIKAVE
ncbi:hypothetical protein [Pseudomonas yamanorum]|jgi:hypothetical protein|uniref:hypothetical protein n=1 Tax=Pseudomonas yamanorum TaxID=515393 RepID=UPI003B9F0681